MGFKPLTKEQRDMLYELRDNTDRKEVARLVGCSPCCAYRWQKRFGGKIISQEEKWRNYPKLREMMAKYWDTLPASEIAEKVGCSVQNIYSYVFYHKLKRSDEAKQKIELKRRKKIKDNQAKQLEIEKRRRVFGLEPLNGRFRKLAPKKVLRAGYNLHLKHGYEYTDDPYVMSRNGNSIANNPKGCDEDYYTKKYGLRFID